MKKPNRFERAATKAASDGYSSAAWVISIADATDLLRKEHEWMRRQLKELSKIQIGDAVYQNGLEVAVQEMVYRLNQRRK